MKEPIIAVTGAHGFIGTQLIQVLVKAGYKAIPVISNNGELRGDERTCDITDPMSTAKALSNSDIVVHLAAISNPAKCAENFDLAYRVNVQGTRNIIQATTTKKLIFASSSHVYGVPSSSDGVCSEEDRLNGMSPYAISKIMGEFLCKNYSHNYGHKINVVRFFNIYGENQQANYVIPLIINQALNQKEISLRRIKVIRDFLYVVDAAEAILQIIKNDEWNNTYNVGSGTGTPISKIVEHVIERLGVMPVSSTNTNPPSEPERLVSNIDKLKKIGWKQQVSLAEGLDKMITHYRRAKLS